MVKACPGCDWVQLLATISEFFHDRALVSIVPFPSLPVTSRILRHHPPILTSEDNRSTLPLLRTSLLSLFHPVISGNGGLSLDHLQSSALQPVVQQ